MNAKLFVPVLKETAQEFGKDKATRLAAALAYYTLFSLAPLLVIAIAIAGIAFGQDAARGKIVAELGHLLGKTAAAGLQEMIANAGKGKGGVFATIIGIVTLLFGASGVFGQLKDALNTIWDAPEKKSGGILGMIKDRFLSFSMVLGVGFLLLVSLVLSAGVAAAGSFMHDRLPGGEVLWQCINFALDFGVVSVLFAFLFRYLPDVRVAWRDVWTGAFFTGALFALGKFAIGLYLGKSSFGSTFGAAASLAVILVWLYYSGLIFFFGAEFTEVHSRANRHQEKGAEGTWRARRETANESQTPAHTPRPRLVTVTAPARSGGGKKVAVAGAAGAGVLVGALAGSIGVVAVVFKGIRKLVGK